MSSDSSIFLFSRPAWESSERIVSGVVSRRALDRDRVAMKPCTCRLDSIQSSGPRRGGPGPHRDGEVKHATALHDVEKSPGWSLLLASWPGRRLAGQIQARSALLAMAKVSNALQCISDGEDRDKHILDRISSFINPPLETASSPRRRKSCRSPASLMARNLAGCGGDQVPALDLSLGTWAGTEPGSVVMFAGLSAASGCDIARCAFVLSFEQQSSAANTHTT